MIRPGEPLNRDRFIEPPEDTTERRLAAFARDNEDDIEHTIRTFESLAQRWYNLFSESMAYADLEDAMVRIKHERTSTQGEQH